ALRKLGRMDEALDPLRKAVEADPTNGAMRRDLANLLLTRGHAGEGVGHLKTLLGQTPGDPDLRITLAWILSTYPDEDARDGALAVRLMEEARPEGPEQPEFLDVKAAAYAEAGRFDDAVKTARRGRELARSRRGNLEQEIAARLKLYEAKKPYRQPR
ncbi:MAG: tetratricopeptide repeat protein, partial [Planctomycetota bacterium]